MSVFFFTASLKCISNETFPGTAVSASLLRELGYVSDNHLEEVWWEVIRTGQLEVLL